jgi:L-fucono-1,5-lactonase
VIVDAHQHFWDPATAHYPWLTDELAPIRRSFRPEDLEPLLRSCGVGGTIAVQARASMDETRELVAVAAEIPWVLGVVGWVDLTAPDVDDVLASLDGRLVGVRHQVHDEPDPRWLLGDDVQRGIAAVGAADLVFDLLVRTAELPAAFETARRHSTVRFVVDHVAKPPLRDGPIDAWSAGLEPLADLPNVCCKLSGLVTEAGWDSWKPEDLIPFYKRALVWFGADRCLFGSDWPVCLLAADYGTTLELVERAMVGLSADVRAAVLGGTAIRTYGLDVSGLTARAGMGRGQPRGN